MDWRREDSGYLAATVGIVGFVAYLIAANFGLVPSPLAPLSDGAPPLVAAIQAPPDVTAAVSVPPPPGPDVDRPSASHPPAIAQAEDTVRPAVRVSTSDGTQVGLTSSPVVEGVASDAASGIDEVLVTFATGSGKQVVPADLTCDAKHTRCTWSAKIPAVIASYSVVARAADRAGNTASSDPIEVSVVNTGGTVEQVGDTAGRVPGAVGGAVERLLDGLDRVLGGG